jgi:small subunit ribosomal protein S19
MRSVWKFPYIEFNLLVKFLQLKYLLKILRNRMKNKKFTRILIKIWDKSSIILSIFVGFSFLIYNGKKFIPLVILKNMIGYRFGEYILTKKIGQTIHIVSKKRKKKRKFKKLKLRRK